MDAAVIHISRSLSTPRQELAGTLGTLAESETESEPSVVLRVTEVECISFFFSHTHIYTHACTKTDGGGGRTSVAPTGSDGPIPARKLEVYPVR